MYSNETLQQAFSAPSVRNLFREIITVDDAVESQEYEKFKDDFEEDVIYEERKAEFLDTMRQGDNYEDSNV